MKLFYIPDKSEEVIRAHDAWYQKYLELKAKKKEAIRNWRRGRTPLRSSIQTA